jgi:hypothetical protein
MWLINNNLRILVISVLLLLIGYSTAHAHGGMAGPHELGPPVITSAVLGIGGYWTVMLWPSRKKMNSHNKPDRRQQRKGRKS